MTGVLARWNTAPTEQVEADLLACCASPGWVRAVVAGRPYPDLAALLAAGDAAIAALPWSEIGRALQTHPRIGERLGAGPGAAGGGGREAEWSSREQAGAQGADRATAAALVAANLAYEARFGHVFLVFATGRTAEELLAVARERLLSDEQTERGVVRAELARIARLRLERLLAG